jgi:hypothetical protein
MNFDLLAGTWDVASRWRTDFLDDSSEFPGVSEAARRFDGIGEFYGDDAHHGTPVRVRFIWSGITGASAH